MKHTALANVRMLYKKFNEDLNRRDIDIVGVGGIKTGEDAFEMILCGAKAVQVGTCHWIEGPKCFERIANELEEIMKKKGYKNIEEFRGKLKPYCKTKNKSNTSFEKVGSNVNYNIKQIFKNIVVIIVSLWSIIIYLFMIVKKK